jgi:hypothetical protein
MEKIEGACSLFPEEKGETFFIYGRYRHWQFHCVVIDHHVAYPCDDHVLPCDRRGLSHDLPNGTHRESSGAAR